MDVTIRRATSADDRFIRDIDFATGFFGQSMDALVDDRSLFDYAISPFLPSSGGIGFIAEHEGQVVGYVVASTQSVTMKSAVNAARVMSSAAFRWPHLSERDRRYLRIRVAALLRAIAGAERRFRTPGGARLHVNLLPVARGNNAGSRLLSALFDLLHDEGARVVHANSYQAQRNPTHSFWVRNGFTEFSRVPTTVWREFGVDGAVDLVCYARELR